MCRRTGWSQWRREIFIAIPWLLVFMGLAYMNMSLEPNIVDYKRGRLREALKNLTTSAGLKGQGGTREMVKELLPILNELGRPHVDAYTASNKLSNLVVKSSAEHDFLKKLGRMLTQVDNALKRNLRKKKSRIFKVKKNGDSVGVNLAVVACGHDHAREAQVLIKSAVLFSMDTNNVHLIIFTDPSTISMLLTQVMKLKWTLNLKFAIDFTFEFHLDSFPNDDPKWREFFRPCSAQRLFFPSLLPHVDSLIYMDADTIFLANVSRIWDVFGRDMRNGEVAAMTSAAEYPAKGYYDTHSKIPYYGKRGAQAGVILMNLTRMREFDIENKAVNAYKAYTKRLVLGDQDIYNVIFHFNPEKLFNLDCSHNFRISHCGGFEPKGICGYHTDPDPAPYCFCFPALDKGVQTLHGVLDIFHKEGSNFMKTTWKRFSELDLAKDSPMEMIQELKKNFKSHSGTCFNLTADAVYSNAYRYLQHVLAG